MGVVSELVVVMVREPVVVVVRIVVIAVVIGVRLVTVVGWVQRVMVVVAVVIVQPVVMTLILILRLVRMLVLVEPEVDLARQGVDVIRAVVNQVHERADHDPHHEDEEAEKARGEPLRVEAPGSTARTHHGTRPVRTGMSPWIDQSPVKRHRTRESPSRSTLRYRLNRFHWNVLVPSCKVHLP